MAFTGYRAYGRVDAIGGEYAQTVFVQFQFLPIIPKGSVWVTAHHGAFAIPLHKRSIAAAYLRWWAPTIAVLALAAPLAIAVPLVVALATASAWAWTWRSRRGALAQRRSVFNRLAFGTRCEPEWMSVDQRARLLRSLTAHWDRLGTPGTPRDIARDGAADAHEAVIAYGVLKLRALESGTRADREAAERVLLGAHAPRTSREIADPAELFATLAAAAERPVAPDLDPPRGSDAGPLASPQVESPLAEASNLIAGGSLLAVAALVLGWVAWRSPLFPPEAYAIITALIFVLVGGGGVIAAMGVMGRRRAMRAQDELDARDPDDLSFN